MYKEEEDVFEDLPQRFGPNRFHSYTTNADFMSSQQTSYFRKSKTGTGSLSMHRRFEPDETHSPGPIYNTDLGPESKTLGKFSGGSAKNDRSDFIPKTHGVGPGQYREDEAWKGQQKHSVVPSPGKERRFRNVTQEQLEKVPGPYMLPYLRPNPVGCRIGPPPEKRREMKHSKSLPNMQHAASIEEKQNSHTRRMGRLQKTSTFKGRTEKVFLGSKLAKKGGGDIGPGPCYYPDTSSFSPFKSPSKSRKWRG